MAIGQVVREAVRRAPSVLYMPAVDVWWENTREEVHAAFISMMEASTT
jgi:hypothetical protein